MALPRDIGPRRPHLVVDVHAGGQQHLHHGQVSVARGQVKRRVLLGVGAEQVGMSAEQKFDHLQPAVERCQVQRRLKLVVAHGGVGQLLQQQLHHPRVPVLSRAVQRRLVVVVLRRRGRRDVVTSVLGPEKCEK